MNINTDEILEAVGTYLDDEAKVNELSGIIALTFVGVIVRRSLRKTLIIAGVDEKLAKRLPSAVGNAATIITIAALSAKRVHDHAYPAKVAKAPNNVVNLFDANAKPVA